MTQNTSHAVMQQRHEAHDSLDFFPTPPWATRAFCEEVLIREFGPLGNLVALEPACGNGAMARPLQEYFGDVLASDVHDYGAGFAVRDFLFPGDAPACDWIITNPPFRLGEQFIRRALNIASIGCAFLVRTAFLESLDRFALFRAKPPALVAQYAERVPMVKGRLDPKASSATAYCWVVWHKDHTDTRMRWIPPSRKRLERPGDYEGVQE